MILSGFMTLYFRNFEILLRYDPIVEDRMRSQKGSTSYKNRGPKEPFNIKLNLQNYESFCFDLQNKPRGND